MARGADPIGRRRGGVVVSAPHRVRAHAKINLGLAVLARRGDGYHEVETVLLRLDLHDVLTVALEGDGVRLRATGLPVPAGEDNLVLRAARAYLEAARSSRGVRITLDKRIPVAAGLGGGSSDAAAVLRALAQLLPAEVDLDALARSLGSDVPFFLADVPAALGRGRGERLTPLEVPPLDLVLVDPGIPVRAADAYAALQNFTPRLRPERIVARLERREEPGLLNGLQPGVLLGHPEIRGVLDALRASGLRGVLLSGSGSTCFGVADDAGVAATVAEGLRRNHPEWRVEVARSV